ncbi:MAG TPA: mitofilin family membrane protein [Hyphomicrobiales bacterium]
MTVNDGSEKDDQQKEGKPQRPFATLDLTAKEVAAKDPPDAGASAPESPGLSAESPQPSADSEEKSFWTREGYAPAYMTNLIIPLASGALGASLAFLIAYAAIDGGAAPEHPATVDLEPLRAEIAQSRKEIAALQGQIRDAAAKSGQIDALRNDAGALKRDLAALTERVGKVEARPEAAGLSPEAVQQSIAPINARLAELDERLTKVAKAQAEVETNTKGAALALALYNLRRATNEGKPFAAELRSVADMSPVPLDLAALEARRDQGIRSFEQLQAGYTAAANKALDAENAPADTSLSSEVWSKVRSFVRIRRKGNVEGDSTRAILARVEYRLDNHDLAGAISEAEALKGPAAEAMAPWLAEVKAKLAADQALAQAETKILTALGGEDQAKRGG